MPSFFFRELELIKLITFNSQYLYDEAQQDSSL